jgi:hypothetical protein
MPSNPPPFDLDVEGALTDSAIEALAELLVDLAEAEQEERS